jgi:hypothetical protein
MKRLPSSARPWPTVDLLSEAIELLHALVIWETHLGEGELPTFAAVGVLEVWSRCDDLMTHEMPLADVLARHLTVVRVLAMETVHNYGVEATRLAPLLVKRCGHAHLRDMIPRLLDAELPN